MTGRTTGVATYRNTDFFGLVDGLNFAAQYQGKNDVTATSPKRTVTAGVCLLSEMNGFGVGATYAKSDRTADQVRLRNLKRERRSGLLA
jgi:outer membrane porin protein LC